MRHIFVGGDLIWQRIRRADRDTRLFVCKIDISKTNTSHPLHTRSVECKRGTAIKRDIS